jgi:SAM-dependent methyltransferase
LASLAVKIFTAESAKYVRKGRKGVGSRVNIQPKFTPVANARSIPDLKQDVQKFWNSDPCGTRYLGGQEDFAAHARARYELEPYIPEFAQFSSARGRKVLEIGVGMGADYLEWLKAGAHATGIDMSAVSIERARRRCEAAGFVPDLRVADAEHLPFADGSFDVVYSYGVMHHSPDTQRCLREAWRVLKPGGEARIMVYHHPSLTALMLWLRYGVLHGKAIRQIVYERLESPGTKTYPKAEIPSLMEGFENLAIRQVFSPGDLLLHRPSARYQSAIYRLAWKLYPRFLAKKFGRNWGLFLLISGKRPLPQRAGSSTP